MSTIPTQTGKLRFIPGLDNIPNAPNLAQSMVVNCIDTEHYERAPAKLTEIGINTFESKDLRRLITNPGPHGENLLKQVYYYHLRMIPNAHCLNTKFCPGDPTANRFGNTRFATYDEGKHMLEECFYWDKTNGRPQDGKCPIMLVGHAIHNDNNELDRAIGFDPQTADTVAVVLDTQNTRYSEDGPGDGNLQPGWLAP